MKKNPIRQNKFILMLGAVLLSSAVLFTSCEKDNNDNNSSNQMYTISGNATGSQVSPSTTSTATGTIAGTYNANTNVLLYTVNWSTLTTTATGVELRGPASVGANGVLVSALTITTPGITGTAAGSITLTDAQETDLLAGKYYYTILTSTNTTGEIRGQVVATLQ